MVQLQRVRVVNAVQCHSSFVTFELNSQLQAPVSHTLPRAGWALMDCRGYTILMGTLLTPRFAPTALISNVFGPKPSLMI